MLKEGQLILFDNGKIKKAEDLSVGSHKRVLVICDMCNKEVGMEYRQYYNKSKKYNGHYYCKYCAAKTEEVKKLRVDGCKKKYGVENCMQNKDVVKHWAEVMSSSGPVPTSSQQNKIYELLKENNYQVTLNKQLSELFLDCEIIIEDIKIDLEYDCWYWHDKKKDDIRDQIVQRYNYKIFRIKANRKIPTIEQLKEGIEILSSTNQNYYTLELESQKKIEKYNKT